jgi:hypothetical protein
MPGSKYFATGLALTQPASAGKEPFVNLNSGHSRRIAAVAVLALGLTLAACAPTTTSQTSQNPRAAAAQRLTLSIAAPADNAEVAAPFEVQLNSDVPLGAPETGEHHVHLYYDTPTPDGPYDLIYGDQAQVANLSPGTHTILASLRNANHTDAGPRAMITVNVTSAADASAVAGTVNQQMPDMPEMANGY